MKRIFSFVFPSLILALAGTASATTLTINSVILPTANDGGEFSATLNGSTVLDIYCADFADPFIYGHTYSINVTTIPPSSTAFLQQTRVGSLPTADFQYFGSTYSSLQRYEMAGFLTTQYATAGTQTAINEIQYAIWALLAADGTTVPNNCDSTCQSDVTSAYSNLSTFLASNVVNIYTIAPPGGTPANEFGCTSYGSGDGVPTLSGEGSGCMQEFVTVSSATPEPSTLALMGLGGGLIGFGALRRRRRNTRK